MVNDVLGTTQSPRYDQPARALPASDTPTDRGGIQLTTLAQRDAQGRLQVQLNNGQPRWVSAVRSYSDDGVTWTTPAAENGTFGVMLGAGTAAGQSMQSPVATIPLSPAPYVRIKTFGVGTDLAGAYADPGFAVPPWRRLRPGNCVDRHSGAGAGAGDERTAHRRADLGQRGRGDDADVGHGDDAVLLGPHDPGGNPGRHRRAEHE